MLFVGRKREVARIERELARSHHLVVTGPYGIGRTSLLRRLSETLRDRWRFIFLDFGRPVAEVGRGLLFELFPQQAGKPDVGAVRSSSVRFRLTRWEPEDPRRHVLVLDNVAALSSRRVRFIADLAASKKYTLVVIVESFLPVPDLDRLRARLAPASLLKLGRLPHETARKYFALVSERYQLGWDAERIAAAARTTQGYPLGMWETVARETQRASTSGNDGLVQGAANRSDPFFSPPTRAGKNRRS
jgi:AAA ATPase domain